MPDIIDITCYLEFQLHVPLSEGNAHNVTEVSNTANDMTILLERVLQLTYFNFRS